LKLRVVPGYGWGWFRKDGTSYEVPPPFDLEAEILIPGRPFRMAQGRVEGGHLLSGMWIVLIQCHENECNLKVVPKPVSIPQTPEPFPDEPEITGYAMVENSN
jgi:hypothetical protein